MNELELLKDELTRVINVANEFKVSHTDVAQENGVGYEYGRQIRNGDKPSKNNKKNQKLLQGLINSYRKEIRRKQDVLTSIDVDAEEIK